MTFTMGRKWDLTNCYTLSATTDSFDITAWTKGDHNDPDAYSSGSGDCTEASANCYGEMVAAVTYLSGSHSVTHDWYDPYDRLIFTYSNTGIAWLSSWIGRFGELNLPLEIYKPGTYKIIETIDGTPTDHYFDVYEQTTNKYVHLQGRSANSSNSWASANTTWSGAQATLTPGAIMNIGEGDYSAQAGFYFSKSQSIKPQSTFGGNINMAGYPQGIPNITGATAFANVSHPIEFDGIIDRWAYWYHGSASNTAKLKIYRGGNAGTANATTSTLIYTSDGHTETSGEGWKTYSMTPQSVLKGDILVLQSSEVENNIGLIYAAGSPDYYCSAPYVAGDPGDTTFNSAGTIAYADIMLRAWKSEPYEIVLPKTS